MGNVTNVTNSGNIQCTIDGSQTLTCTVNVSAISIGATTGKFDVVIPVTSIQGGTYDNPRSAGNCQVDPSGNVTETERATTIVL